MFTIKSATFYEARMLETPNDPEKSEWTLLTDEEGELRRNNYNDCLETAKRCLHNDGVTSPAVYQQALLHLVIARCDVTYILSLIEGREGFNCPTCDKRHEYGTTYCNECGEDLDESTITHNSM